MSKFKFLSQLNTIIEWYNQGNSYAQIARFLNSDNIDRDAGCIRRLLRKYLGDIHGHPKKVITEEMKSQISVLLKRRQGSKENFRYLKDQASNNIMVFEK